LLGRAHIVVGHFLKLAVVWTGLIRTLDMFLTMLRHAASDVTL